MLGRTSAAVLLALTCCQGGTAWAGPGLDIGNAVAVRNTVTAALADDTRRLGIGDDVRQDELIEVGVDSRGELKFKDETKLALAAGARVILDKFVYDPDQSSGSIVMNLAKGAFRFITGVASKPAYKIKTPTASISVRGTVFDVDVSANGATWLLLIEGAVEVCNLQGVCRFLDQPGMIIRVDPEGAVSPPARWTKLPGVKKVRFDDRFPFVDSPPSFDPTPILTKQTILWGALPPRWPRDRGDGGPPHGHGPKGDGTKVDGKRTGDGSATTPSTGRKGGKTRVTRVTKQPHGKKADVVYPKIPLKITFGSRTTHTTHMGPKVPRTMPPMMGPHRKY